MNYIWNLKDLAKVEKNGYKVFSCFSCGGGSSMGYKLAGYEVIGNCEIDPKMNEMYLKNFSPKYSYLMGVQDLYKQKDLPKELFDLDILDGSPPCSTFSTVGLREKVWGKKKQFREGQEKQVLSDLFFEFLNVAELLKPKIIVAENVTGIIKGNAKGYINLIAKRFDELGYTLQIFQLNGATMGVPQKRERVFFIGSKKDLNFPKIKLEFNEKPILYEEFADDNCKLLSTESLTYKRWLKRKSTDRNIKAIVLRTEKNKISGFSCGFFRLKEVPLTITANGTLLRYDKPGTLSDKDIITISTFPQDYNFNKQGVQYVCGMSVPPLMMYGVSKQVQLQLLDKLTK